MHPKPGKSGKQKENAQYVKKIDSCHFVIYSKLENHFYCYARYAKNVLQSSHHTIDINLTLSSFLQSGKSQFGRFSSVFRIFVQREPFETIFDDSTIFHGPYSPQDNNADFAFPLPLFAAFSVFNNLFQNASKYFTSPARANLPPPPCNYGLMEAWHIICL